MTATKTPLHALDELMSHPRLPEIIGQAREVLTANGYRALLDQGDAAARETRHNLRRQATATGSVIKPVRHHEHPPWVRHSILAAILTWISGKAQTCIHAPNARRPMPVVAAAWKPGLVVCAACSYLLDLPRDSAENWTCDGCRTVTRPAVDGEGRILTLTLTYGLFTYQAGLCHACHYKPLPRARRKRAGSS